MNDEFTLGQWLKGRIYERRCDLSPDGKHFIYFAMNGRWKSDGLGAWTAISRSPFLKAIGFWPKGDCWNGGGHFLSRKQYWINGFEFHEERRIPPGLTRVNSCPGVEHGMGEDPQLYYPRLRRDGWVQDTRFVGGTIWLFEKEIDDGWILRKRAMATSSALSGKGCYYDKHELENLDNGNHITCGDWEWADYVRGRLLWSTGGAIYAGRLTKDGIRGETMLKDFNDMTFEPIKAPY